MTEIIIKAYDVRDEYLIHPGYLELKILDKTIKEQYADLLLRFQHARTAYETVMDTGGNHHPDYKDVVKMLMEAKTNLYELPEVKRILMLEKTLQDDLNDFMSKLAMEISPHIQTSGAIGLTRKGEACHAR